MPVACGGAPRVIAATALVAVLGLACRDAGAPARGNRVAVTFTVALASGATCVYASEGGSARWYNAAAEGPPAMVAQYLLGDSLELLQHLPGRTDPPVGTFAASSVAQGDRLDIGAGLRLFDLQSGFIDARTSTVSLDTVTPERVAGRLHLDYASVGAGHPPFARVTGTFSLPRRAPGSPANSGLQTKRCP
jgi:hypothetical protein